MDKTGSSGSCDSCHTFIWLFPVRLMFLQMVSTLPIHSGKTSGQQLFPLHSQATQDSHQGCSGDFDSFWFREITRQSDETSWSPKLMGYCDMGLWLWYWGRLRGEKKQNRMPSAFPAHFPSSTGRKLVSLKVQSAVEMDMAKQCLPYLARVLVRESAGIGSWISCSDSLWFAQGFRWAKPWPGHAKLELHHQAISVISHQLLIYSYVSSLWTAVRKQGLW